MTTPPRTPTTLGAAWEALAEDPGMPYGYGIDDIIARHRPLIEAEAVAAERARLRAAVEELRDDDRAATGEVDATGQWGYVQWLRESAVLALLEPLP